MLFSKERIAEAILQLHDDPALPGALLGILIS
jgi:hypothetical protein